MLSERSIEIDKLSIIFKQFLIFSASSHWTIHFGADLKPFRNFLTMSLITFPCPFLAKQYPCFIYFTYVLAWA